MAQITRSRVLATAPGPIWEVISDAYARPRWWPRVTRVEGVKETGYTEVMYSRRGRAIRLDLSYTEVEPGAVLAWQLDIPGGQFERLLSEWHTRMVLAPEAGGTRVSIEERQTFRGSFRTGGLLQRRAARKRLDAALKGLAELL